MYKKKKAFISETGTATLPLRARPFALTSLFSHPSQQHPVSLKREVREPAGHTYREIACRSLPANTRSARNTPAACVMAAVRLLS